MGTLCKSETVHPMCVCNRPGLCPGGLSEPAAVTESFGATSGSGLILASSFLDEPNRSFPSVSSTSVSCVELR